MSIPSFDLEVIRNDATARIVLTGEIDIATVPRIEEAIREIAADPGVDIVLDLRGVAFMDSTGLRMLIQTQAQSERDDFRLSIVRGPSQLDRLFSVAGVTDVLPFVDEPPPGA